MDGISMRDSEGRHVAPDGAPPSRAPSWNQKRRFALWIPLLSPFVASQIKPEVLNVAADVAYKAKRDYIARLDPYSQYALHKTTQHHKGSVPCWVSTVTACGKGQVRWQLVGAFATKHAPLR